MNPNQGEYTLVADGRDFDVAGKIDGMKVGSAVGMREHDRLTLSDITVREDVSPPWPIFQVFLVMNYRPRRPWQLRHRGIGTALLERFLHEADKAGIREVVGSVMPDAVAKQPTLLAWYERHGFTVECAITSRFRLRAPPSRASLASCSGLRRRRTPLVPNRILASAPIFLTYKN